MCLKFDGGVTGSAAECPAIIVSIEVCDIGVLFE